jgi:hypothetical protein
LHNARSGFRDPGEIDLAVDRVAEAGCLEHLRVARLNGRIGVDRDIRRAAEEPNIGQRVAAPLFLGTATRALAVEQASRAPVAAMLIASSLLDIQAPRHAGIYSR